MVDKKSIAIQGLHIAILPFAVMLMQLLDHSFSWVLIVFLAISIVFLKEKKREILLVLITACGYLICAWTSAEIKSVIPAGQWGDAWGVILARLGLLGYISLFWVWHLLEKPCNSYFQAGDWKAPIQLPFIWYGVREKVFRFTAVFSTGCILFAGIFAVFNHLTIMMLFFGIIFAIVNSILEEILWRGFLLSRTCGLYGEKAGLLAMSLAFGFYHFTLGFSLWACLAFSLGGIYFGGTALRSKGLLCPVIMHISMNLLFVGMGIIF